MKKFIRLKRISNQKIDIMILDKFGSELLKRCLPDGANSVVLPSSSIPYNLDPKYWALVLRQVFTGPYKRSALVEAFIRSADIRVIISFIDNQVSLGQLQENNPERLVIAVQNGVRVDRLDSLGGWGTGIPIPHYYGFGDYERDLIKDVGAKPYEYIRSGSLKMGLALSRYKCNSARKKYDVCFVSYFREKRSAELRQRIKPLLTTNKELFDIIYRVCAEKKYRLCVAMFSEKDLTNEREDINFDKEIAYYQNGLNDANIDFIPNDFLKLESYNTALKSKLVLGISSTLLFEIFGAGKRTLFGGILHTPERDMYLSLFSKMPGEVLLQEMDGNHIHKRIEALLHMKEEDYLQKTESARNYYMRCEPPYPHEMIKKRIAEYLNIPAK